MESHHHTTVNFLATRLWEEISMYNHVTNDWGDKERLMSVDPRHPAAAEHLVAEVLASADPTGKTSAPR